MAGNQGLSPNSNMDDKKRQEIHVEGGKASGSRRSGSTQNSDSTVIRNHAGGGRLTKADQRKGGHMSHKND